MAEALKRANSSYSAPNPSVGCVIVRDGVMVGAGTSEPAGGAHAEIVALREAGESARGATSYVTLEPCNHQGRTGPCSVALAQAGVARVVYGASDPDPNAMGGADRLRELGVEVEGGVLRAECEDAHEQFLWSVTHKRPFMTIKAAITLDGLIARPDGSSKWITGTEARADAQRLRAKRGAVLVGAGTVAADDPLLTARIDGVVNQPLRIVLGGSKRLSGREQVFGADAETWWVRERIEPKMLLTQLYQRGVRGLLVEGGAQTIAQFLAAGVAQEIVLYVGPKTFGSGLVWHGGSGFPDGWNLYDMSKFEHTVRLTYRPTKDPLT